jgi:hypothetical protein
VPVLFAEAMARLPLSMSSLALLLLLFRVDVCAFRMRSQSESDMQPANVDIADIHRHNDDNWSIIKDSQVVGVHVNGAYSSAKPLHIAWSRIGTWNYRHDKKETGALIKVRLNGRDGALVKTDLALRFQYGGRGKHWASHPELHNKGRFLRKVRVVPLRTYVNSGYKLDARVTKATAARVGTRSDPVAELKLKIRIVYGKRGTLFSTYHKKNYEVTVQGTGHYSARLVSSEGR